MYCLLYYPEESRCGSPILTVMLKFLRRGMGLLWFFKYNPSLGGWKGEGREPWHPLIWVNRHGPVKFLTVRIYLHLWWIWKKEHLFRTSGIHIILKRGLNPTINYLNVLGLVIPDSFIHIFVTGHEQSEVIYHTLRQSRALSPCPGTSLCIIILCRRSHVLMFVFYYVRRTYPDRCLSSLSQ